ncbi:MAG TPA: hypothetical protein VEA44_05065 [Caulobacter sp.]|nr:hypothetical protein [Caulobacter sp.]
MTAFPANIDLSSLDGIIGFRISGVAQLDHSGRAVGWAGDVNGDGFDDLIIGASDSRSVQTSLYSSTNYVVFGSDAGFPANLNLSDLNGTNGFRLDGAPSLTGGGGFGARAGDVNADGFDDLIIFSGGNYVVFGSDAGFPAIFSLPALDGTNGFRISGAATDISLGYSVASAGDVNGDGIDDMIIGARGASANGANSGGGYVVFGSGAGFGANLDLSTLDGSNGFRISGVAAGDEAGYRVAGAGDLNGDGLADLVIGAFLADPNGADSGASYVVFGSDAGFAANLDLSALTGSNGFRISGAAAGDNSGFTVASAGDFNGDGIDDLIVGAWRADANGGDSGASYVVFGDDAGFAANLELSSLDGTNGFRIRGAAAGDRSGWAVASAGDVNGDGFADLIIGAPYADPHGANSGTAYVVFGGQAAFGADLDLASLTGAGGFRISGVAAYDRSASWAARAGDINGDGVDDLIIGATSADVNGGNSGASYVIFGRAQLPVIEGGTAGEDSYAGGSLDDQLSGAGGDDVLSGLGGDDLLDGGDLSDLLYGGGGADDLVGGLGHDLLDGGVGADAMAGGAGDDTYIVDDAGDVVTELGGEGSDRVRATVSVVLADNLENLTLEGSGDIDGTGNGLSNVLDGNSGANVLSGAGGNDLIKGHLGDDTLNGNAGNDQLLGGDGADILDGGADNDRLDGGAGIDGLTGGAGADILEGGAEGDTLNGDAGADQLLGGDGADTLNGGSENDLLNGGTGADAMTGGAGDDSYVVDNAGDTTVEASGQGSDQVRASISHTLGDHIEILILEGAGALNGTGNGLANTLNGNGGDNLLDGAGGNDVLKGGLGADSLIGGAGADILLGGGGADSFVVRQESVYSSLVPAGRSLEVDTVSDYAADDRIDLSAIDAVSGGADDAFTQVSAFDGQAGRLVLGFAGGITTLSLDVDGDRTADYLMKINGDARGEIGDWLL